MYSIRLVPGKLMILPILLRRPYLLPLHYYGCLQQTPTTTSSMLLCPLVPTHKLPDGSSSIPWQTSRHLHYVVGKDALLHLARWMLSLPSSPQTSKRILCPYKPSPCCHLQCSQLLTYRIHHSTGFTTLHQPSHPHQQYLLWS